MSLVINLELNSQSTNSRQNGREETRFINYWHFIPVVDRDKIADFSREFPLFQTFAATILIVRLVWLERELSE